jgi:hypothetical protein
MARAPHVSLPARASTSHRTAAEIRPPCSRETRRVEHPCRSREYPLSGATASALITRRWKRTLNPATCVSDRTYRISPQMPQEARFRSPSDEHPPRTQIGAAGRPARSVSRPCGDDGRAPDRGRRPHSSRGLCRTRITLGRHDLGRRAPEAIGPPEVAVILPGSRSSAGRRPRSGPGVHGPGSPGIRDPRARSCRRGRTAPPRRPG